MAIIKLGTMVVGIRGTMGGITFSANGAGPYAKTWQRPPRPTKTLQSTRQQAFSEFAARWTTLTDTQRDDWNDWAAADAPPRTNSLGETILLTGYQWHQSVNTLLALQGKAYRAIPPTVDPPAAPTITSWNPRQTGVGVTSFGYPANEFNGFFLYALISMAPRQSSVSFNRPNYYEVAEDNPGTNSTIITSQMEAIYGEIQDGRRWFAQVARMTTQGLLSASTNLFTDTIT